MQVRHPRVVVAGLSGDAGKTLVTLGLARALSEAGTRVAPFKKGPDFIDAAWLGAAAGTAGRNLDTFMMPLDAVRRSVAQSAASSDIAIVEGNRGVFDGLDVDGSHSTAALAKTIGAPLILVVDVTKMTRTVAALVAGCLALDPNLPLAGVILNRVGTARQEALIREAITRDAGVPVLGAVGKLEQPLLPSRHLGLVPSVEHPHAVEALEQIAIAVKAAVDLSAVQSIARRAGPLEAANEGEPAPVGSTRIGVLRDKALSFYYPENLEALQAAGATLVEVSPLADEALPSVDGLYAGGGFPEVYARRLAENTSLATALRWQISAGMPVWAECGGLMYLSQAIHDRGESHAMVGALPIEVERMSRPQGHGYVEARVDGENPFLACDTTIRGHEFHYTQVSERSHGDLSTVLALERGVGVGDGRDGIRSGNLVASYTHIHALGAPAWAPALVRAARGRTP